MTRPVPQTCWRALRPWRSGTRGRPDRRSGQVAELRALSRARMEIEIDTPHTFKESVEVFRIGRREVEANPDGIDFHGPDVRNHARFSVCSRGRRRATRTASRFQAGAPPCWSQSIRPLAHLAR
jgi:hypothetical protein